MNELETIKNLIHAYKSVNLVKQNVFFTETTFIKPTISQKLIDSITFEHSTDLKYIILCMIGLDKASIYSQDWEPFVSLLTQENIETQEKVLDIVFKKLESFNRYDQIVDLIDFKFMDLYQENLQKYQIVESLQIDFFEPNMNFIKRLVVTTNGVVYKPPEPEVSNRVIRRFEKYKKYFVRVKCQGDQINNFVAQILYKDIFKNFHILNKPYEFLAYSSSQLRQNSCWFIQLNPEITKDQILNSLGDFSKLPIAAKKAARIGMSFAQSIPFNSENEVEIIKIPDDEIDGLAYTDGIGMISNKLMAEAQKQCKIPGLTSAIQVRYRGSKGVLCANKDLPDNVVKLRKSMIKFETEQETAIDVLDWSKYRPGTLNRQIIILLLSLGTNPDHFQQLQNENLKELEENNIKDASIFQNCEYSEDHRIVNLIRDMINVGCDPTSEPFVVGVFRALKQRAYLLLRKKSNIFVKDSARLMGVIDEFDILQEGEIFVRVSENNTLQDSFVVESEVMVTRNPCLHPGDIKIMKAVDPKSDKFDSMVNVVVFPKKGKVPITHEIAGGDLDGDQYFVAWDPRLIPPKTFPSMEYDNVPKPKQKNPKSDSNAIINFFMDYINNEQLGKIDNSHLAMADQCEKMALDDKCLQLSILHSIAVDYPKSGVPNNNVDRKLFTQTFPDYMEDKNPDKKYESQTILGVMFRQIKAILNDMQAQNTLKSNFNQHKLDNTLIKEGWIEYLQKEIEVVYAYQHDIKNLLDIFKVDNEFELVSGNISTFDKQDKQTSSEVFQIQFRILDNLKYLKKKYNEIFYREFQNNMEDKESMFKKASCWYICSYLNSNIIMQDRDEQIYNNDDFKTLQAHPIYQRLDRQDTRYLSLCWFAISDIMIDLKKANFVSVKVDDETFKNMDEVQDSDDDYL